MKNDLLLSSGSDCSEKRSFSCVFFFMLLGMYWGISTKIMKIYWWWIQKGAGGFDSGKAAQAADRNSQHLVPQWATYFEKSNLSFFLQLVGKCTFSGGLLMFCCVNYCWTNKIVIIILNTCIVPSGWGSTKVDIHFPHFTSTSPCVIPEESVGGLG